MARRAAKRDKNEKEIVAFLEQCGCSVMRLNCADASIPDICAALNGHNIFLELKSKGGKPSEGQAQFWQTWKGATGIAYDPIQALYHVLLAAMPELNSEFRRSICELAYQYKGTYNNPLTQAFIKINE